MVSARRKYEWARLPGVRTTRRKSPRDDSVTRVECIAPREPPSAFSPCTPASASTSVDLPEPFSPTRKVTPAGRLSPCSSTAATAGILAHQALGSISAPAARSIRRIGRGASLLVILVAAGQPGGEPLDRRLELRMEVDEGAQLLAQPFQRHGLLAAPVDEFLDAPVGEVHAGIVLSRQTRGGAPLSRSAPVELRPRQRRLDQRRLLGVVHLRRADRRSRRRRPGDAAQAHA